MSFSSVLPYLPKWDLLLDIIPGKLDRLLLPGKLPFLSLDEPMLTRLILYN